MTPVDKAALASISHLLEYPDAGFFEAVPDLRAVIKESAPCAQREAMLNFLAELEKMGLQASQEDYVSVFDHDPESSLYMTWHRYGNDRSQGKAMAALNGLYRAAGFEPVRGTLPDYLPRMFEFMSVCDDWATEVLLDGFGPELAKMIRHLYEIESCHAPLLEAAIAPLRQQWPKYFEPRTKPDPTARPFANPEPECAPPELLRQPGKKNNGPDNNCPFDTGA